MADCKKEAIKQSVANIPDALEQLQKSTENKDTEKMVVALCAIADLCSEANQKNQIKAVKTGCHEQIVKTLAAFPTHADLVEEGLRSFNNMACNNLENKASLASAGAVQCVVASLKAHPTHRGVVEWGVGASTSPHSTPPFPNPPLKQTPTSLSYFQPTACLSLSQLIEPHLNSNSPIHRHRPGE